MDNFTANTLRTKRGLTYHYYHYDSSDSSKPLILACYGSPDDIHILEEILPYLLPMGYPLLIPDLLGYGGTDKPLDVVRYNVKLMSNDLIEIIDSITGDPQSSFIAPGHNWGAYMAQRMYTFYQTRTCGSALLQLSYKSLLRPFNTCTEVNDESEKLTGYRVYEFMNFLTSKDASRITENHLASFWCAIHCSDRYHLLFVNDGLRNFLEKDEHASLKPYVQNKTLKRNFIAHIEHDGIAAPLNWYHSVFQHVSK